MTPDIRGIVPDAFYTANDSKTGLCLAVWYEPGKDTEPPTCLDVLSFLSDSLVHHAAHHIDKFDGGFKS